MYHDQAQRDFARNLRNSPTPAEQRLWHLLRAKTRRSQVSPAAAIGPYIVDVVCFSQRLIIELDGPQHLEPDAVDHDRHRTDWLRSRGFHVLRFRNQELDENVHSVVATIERALVESSARAQHPPQPSPPWGREPNLLELVLSFARN